MDSLGKAGEVIHVKDGYARNYLIPKNKAKAATEGNMKIQGALKKKRQAVEAKVLEEARAAADKISALSLTISAATGDEEKLYGSVTSEDIANALNEEGVKVDKRDIVLDEPIKKLGVYQAVVKVHPEVKANLRVWIVKK
ncbi:MAG: 50S ribosomal protein L9 [Candidatus Omnitrophota bacterium]|nr:50S ribosomal protein L9 [Candidatus Omnitrophota bacterium]